MRRLPCGAMYPVKLQRITQPRFGPFEVTNAHQAAAKPVQCDGVLGRAAAGLLSLWLGLDPRQQLLEAPVGVTDGVALEVLHPKPGLALEFLLRQRAARALGCICPRLLCPLPLAARRVGGALRHVLPLERLLLQLLCL